MTRGQEFFGARWVEKGVVYVSAREVGLIQPDRSTRILLQIPGGEACVPSVLASPSGRYLAIPRERPDSDGLRWITIEVLDLTKL